MRRVLSWLSTDLATPKPGVFVLYSTHTTPPKMKRFLHTALLTLFALTCAAAVKAQGTLPIAAGTDITQGARYTSADGEYYLTFQTDGNLVIYRTDGNQYHWGFDQFGYVLGSAKTARLEQGGNLTLSDGDGAVLWSALRQSPEDPGVTLRMYQGELVLMSSSGDVLWGFVRSKPVAAERGEIDRLRPSLSSCRAGLDLLSENGYQYPNDPAAASTGGRAWTSVMASFRQDYLPGCQAIGAFLERWKGSVVLDAIASADDADGVTDWNARMSGAGGIVTVGEEISANCPSRHGSGFDCVVSASTLANVVVPQARAVIDVLNPLECMPTNGWMHCLKIDVPDIRIMGSAAVSPSALMLTKHIYTEMTQRLHSGYDRSVFDGYIAYMTNGEPWSELAGLAPIGGMMGPPGGDELRGGSGGNHLWISEQMVCKTGVATRNQAYAEGRRSQRDDTYRSFDQVVHEFGHTIDAKYGMRSQIEAFYFGGWNPVEQFPWSIQAWFETPKQIMTPRERAYIGDLFASATTFSCDDYDPNATFTSNEQTAETGALETAELTIFPNPFAGAVSVSFVLDRTEHATLTVYDLLGRVVEVVANEAFPAGHSTVEWDASGFPNGLYLYRFKAGSSVRMGTMLRAE